MAGRLAKEDYYACLNRIASNKDSRDYMHLQKIIDDYYELCDERVEMFEYMRKKCRQLERRSRVVKASDYMKFFLGPFYRSRKNSA